MARKFNAVWRKKTRCLGVLTIFKQALLCTLEKNRASKTALLNLPFSRAVRLPFAIILLRGRVETNRVKPVSQGRVTGQKSCVHAGLQPFDGHSHSTNPIIWDCIFYVFTDKLFANLLMFHLLFLAAQFLSIKIVSQKAEKCNHIPRLFQITSHFSLILFLDMF